jgi:hypothetical protein
MFKALSTAALLAASFHVGAASEKPATLHTGVMYAPVGSAGLLCHAINVTEAPVTVMIELIVSGGVIVSSVSGPLGPRLLYSAGSSQFPSGHCRVTVQGPATSVRAAICHWQSNGCISTLEAR